MMAQARIRLGPDNAGEISCLGTEAMEVVSRKGRVVPDFGSEYICKTKTCNAAFCAAVGAVNCQAIYLSDPVASYQCEHMKKNALMAFCPGTGFFGNLW